MKIVFKILATLMLAVTAIPVLAASPNSNVACPVDTPYDVSFEDKFGWDVVDKMRCNERRSEVKLVMQVNQPGFYGFRNLNNIIKDFEITHGIKKWEIAIVVHSGGWPMVVKDNEYEEEIKEFIANPNINIYYCLNTASARGHMTSDIIDGVKFVPAGLSAIMDFQYQGYKYIQP